MAIIEVHHSRCFASIFFIFKNLKSVCFFIIENFRDILLVVIRKTMAACLLLFSPIFAHAAIPLTVNLSENVTVIGTPRLQLNIGGVTRFAPYVSGSGTSTLTFSYNVVAPDFDRDGLALVSPLDLNGGTIRDLNGNNANLAFVPPNTSGVLVQSYQVNWISAPLNGTNIQSGQFSITGAPIGATYNYSVTSSGGGGSVTGSGLITIDPQTISALDLRNLPLGTFTLSATVTALSGTGNAKTDTVLGNVITNIGQITNLSTGNYPVRANNEAFTGYVNNVAGTRWFLVGRGRNNWDFDADGQGVNANVISGLGTSAAFAPRAYNNAIINDLVTRAFINLTGVEIRLNRAANITGTSFQEVLWRPISLTSWTWDFPGADYDIEYDLKASALGIAYLDLTGKTRDSMMTPISSSGNNYTRIFTWGWGSQGNQKGFCYGSTVQGVDNNDANTFMWELTTEAHACPYTEVYIRAE